MRYIPRVVDLLLHSLVCLSLHIEGPKAVGSSSRPPSARCLALTCSLFNYMYLYSLSSHVETKTTPSMTKTVMVDSHGPAHRWPLYLPASVAHVLPVYRLHVLLLPLPDNTDASQLERSPVHTL